MILGGMSVDEWHLYLPTLVQTSWEKNTSPNPKQNSLNPNDRGVGGVSMLVLMNTNTNPKWTSYTLMIETPDLNPNDRGVEGIGIFPVHSIDNLGPNKLPKT